MGLKFWSLPIFSLLLLGGIIFVARNDLNFYAEANFKCLKCHKGSQSLEKIIKEKGITKADELRNLVRKGPKAGLHTTSSEEDLEKAINYLQLK